MLEIFICTECQRVGPCFKVIFSNQSEKPRGCTVSKYETSSSWFKSDLATLSTTIQKEKAQEVSHVDIFE